MMPVQMGKLVLQRCQHCGHVLFYPRTHCDACQSDQLAWEDASGAGTIASYTVVRRAVSADFEAPYVIALIDLAEGPRMMSQIIDADPDALAVGLSVKVDFAAWSEDITLPVFRLHPALDGGGSLDPRALLERENHEQQDRLPWPSLIQMRPLKVSRPSNLNIDNGAEIYGKDGYFSAEYMQREWDKVWTESWLIAGVSTDLPEVLGDYFLFRVRSESIIVTQTEEGVKAVL